MRYKEMLYEMAIARRGDFHYDPMMLGKLTRYGYDNSWKVRDTITVDDTEYEIISHKNGLAWMVGSMDVEINDINEEIETFQYIFTIRFDDRQSIAEKLGYKNLYQVNIVAVHDDARKRNLAKTMYKKLVKEYGYNIIGDREQYFGARKLWAKLSRDVDVVVDLVDIAAGKIIENDVILHHGNYDEDFDQRVWSLGVEKEQIRTILIDLI